MVGLFAEHSAGTGWADLSYAERLALWALREFTGGDARRCPPAPAEPQYLNWELAGEWDGIEAGFRRAAAEMARRGTGPIRLGCRGSLCLGADEALLLHCLAALQNEGPPDFRLRRLVPQAEARAAFTRALAALAAALASCGCWLTPAAPSAVAALGSERAALGA